MLPSDGPLTPEQRTDVQEAAEAYRQKNGITYKSLAHQVGGLNTSAVSELLKGKYRKVKDATIDEHLRAINDWMEVDARRRRTKPQTQYVETHVAKRLYGCAIKASEMRTMALAHGPSGIGKTMVAHVIVERFPGTVYVRLSEGNTSQTAFRQLLASRLRLYSRRRTRSDRPGLTLNERIFDKLRDSGRLILIDEAHRISDAALEFIRDVFDECGVPILLLCTKDLLDRVRKDADEDHGQLYSRFGYVCDLVKDRDKVPGGAHPLFTIGEIRKMFAGDTVRLLPEAEQYLQDVANMLGYGSLRRCREIMKWAVAIERSVKALGVDDALTVSAALLRKAESEPRADRSMLADMEARTGAMAASA